MPSEKIAYVPVLLDKETEILVEAHVVGGEQDIAAWDKMELDELGNQISKLSKKLFQHLKDAGPQKVVAQFGLSVAVKSGKLTTILVDGQADASITVTLEWNFTSRSERNENA